MVLTLFTILRGGIPNVTSGLVQLMLKTAQLLLLFSA